MRLVPDIAAVQDGIFTRAQARTEGFSPFQIRQRVQHGVWNALSRDVFHLAAHPPGPRGRILAAGLITSGAVSHWSAADLHGLDLPGRPSPDLALVDITTSRPLHVNVPGVVEHRLRVRPSDVVQICGIAVTSRTRTLIDLMAWLPWPKAASVLFRAVQEGWLDEATLGQWIRIRPGWHGTPQLRQLSGWLTSGAHAVSERELHRLLDEAGIPYRANVTLALADGTRAIVDVLLTGHRIVIEVDGRRYHSSTESFQRDRRRQNALVNDGYTVLRFTWLDLMQEPAKVISVIRRQLAAAA